MMWLLYQADAQADDPSWFGELHSVGFVMK